jgi:hypothetical protein
LSPGTYQENVSIFAVRWEAPERSARVRLIARADTGSQRRVRDVSSYRPACPRVCHAASNALKWRCIPAWFAYYLCCSSSAATIRRRSQKPPAEPSAVVVTELCAISPPAFPVVTPLADRAVPRTVTRTCTRLLRPVQLDFAPLPILIKANAERAKADLILVGCQSPSAGHVSRLGLAESTIMRGTANDEICERLPKTGSRTGIGSRGFSGALEAATRECRKDLLSGPDAGNPRPIFGPETISRPGAGVVGGVISGLVDY